MTTPLTFQHAGETLTVLLSEYGNGATAVQAVDATGAPYATLSVNIPGESEKLPKGAFFLKDYSENEAVAKAFLAQIPTTPSFRTAKAGFVEVLAYGIGSAYTE